MSIKVPCSVREENHDDICEVCNWARHLSADTALIMLAVIAQRVFDRRLRVDLHYRGVETQRVNTDSFLTISTGIFNAILKKLFQREQDVELVKLITEHANDQHIGLCNQIAAVICGTYIEMGDGALLADDEALFIIRDMLINLDGDIMERNRLKYITRKETFRAKFTSNK